MKKKVLAVFSLLYKIIVPLISAVFGLIVVEQFNILQALSIIKDADKAFDVCLPLYITIVDAVLLSVLEWIKNTFFPSQFIRVTFSKPGDIVQSETVPDLLLGNDSPHEARITVQINAKKKTCKELKVIVECVNFATMQLPTVSTAANVDANGNYIINLEKMFGNQEYVNTSQTFRILFSKEPSNGICQSELYSKLNNEPLMLDFNTNKMILRTE